jgi:molybdopterin synthase catalytic subunit
MDRVRVQTEPFDMAAEVAAVQHGDAGVGAVVSFVGTVRDLSPQAGDALQALELEHYPGMTERSLEALVAQARQRFDVRGVSLIHRVGRLTVGEGIVLVVVASAHRGDAFAACEFLMDYLKTQAPFWKKEHTAAGAQWVAARASDDLACARWVQADGPGVLAARPASAS